MDVARGRGSHLSQHNPSSRSDAPFADNPTATQSNRSPTEDQKSHFHICSEFTDLTFLTHLTDGHASFTSDSSFVFYAFRNGHGDWHRRSGISRSAPG